MKSVISGFLPADSFHKNSLCSRHYTWRQQRHFYDQFPTAARHYHTGSRDWCLYHNSYFHHVAVVLVCYASFPLKTFQFASSRRTAPQFSSSISFNHSSSTCQPFTRATIFIISMHLFCVMSEERAHVCRERPFLAHVDIVKV